MNEFDLKGSKKRLIHQTHEQTHYMEDGIIKCGLLLSLKKMFDRKKNSIEMFFDYFFKFWKKFN